MQRAVRWNEYNLMNLEISMHPSSQHHNLHRKYAHHFQEFLPTLFNCLIVAASFNCLLFCALFKLLGAIPSLNLVAMFFDFAYALDSKSKS